jgi:hypothetical protein
LVGFDVLQQQINPIRRFNSNAQTPDSGITLTFGEPQRFNAFFRKAKAALRSRRLVTKDSSTSPS